MNNLLSILDSSFVILVLGSIIVPLVAYVFTRLRDDQKEKRAKHKEKANKILIILYRYSIVIDYCEKAEGMYENAQYGELCDYLELAKNVLDGKFRYVPIEPEVERDIPLVGIRSQVIPLEDFTGQALPEPIQMLRDFDAVISEIKGDGTFEVEVRYKKYQEDLVKNLKNIEADRMAISEYLS